MLFRATGHMSELRHQCRLLQVSAEPAAQRGAQNIAIVIATPGLLGALPTCRHCTPHAAAAVG